MFLALDRLYFSKQMKVIDVASLCCNWLMPNSFIVEFIRTFVMQNCVTHAAAAYLLFSFATYLAYVGQKSYWTKVMI